MGKATPLPNLRNLLASEYQQLPAHQLDEALQRALGDVTPENLEDFLRGLQQVGGAILQALPAVVPIVATAIGGPVGGIVGTAAGTAIGAATHQAKRPASMRRKAAARPAPPAPPAAPVPATPPAAAPTTTAPAPPGSPAAAQLLGVLFRPEVFQALLAMVLGPMSQRHVTVGSMPVPLGAFANLLAVLANQAATEYNSVVSGGEAVPEYLVDEHSGFKCDVTVPEERAQVLLSHLRATSPVSAESDDPAEWDEWQWDEYEWLAEQDALYDQLDLAELDELDESDDLEAEGI